LGIESRLGGRSQEDVMRRTAVAFTMILAALSVAGTAYAQSYGTPVVQSSDPTPEQGQTITVSGSGCPPNSDVELLLDGQPAGSTTSNSDGSYSGSVTIPPDESTGTHSVTANCGTEVLAFEIEVQPMGSTAAAAGTSGSGLARTGSSSTVPLTTVALGLLAAGGLFVVIARRRRDRSMV
jgi:LPXTG-motif cell wall-anchored protein